MRNLLRTFPKARTGTTAIEFALVAPLYFMPIFGTLEVALAGWYATIVKEGAERGAAYMRDQRLTGQP